MTEIQKYTLAIDVGGTFIKYGIVENNNKVILHHKVPTLNVSDKTHLFDYICNNIPQSGHTLINCVGVSAPGLIDGHFTVRSYAAPSLEALYGANIKEEMEKRINLPVAAINDARAAGLCELKLGNARGTNLSAFLIIGTGGGGCICGRDDIFAGTDNFAGEFHFLSYYDSSEDKDIKIGRTIGMMGLVNEYNHLSSEAAPAVYGRDVINRAHDGEVSAQTAVSRWIHRIALQCLNIIVAINPEVLCIGGGISEEQWFMDAVYKEYNRICMEHFNGARFLTTQIRPCAYHNDSNLLGAALKANMVYSDVGRA